MKHGTFSDGVYTKYEKESQKLRMGNSSWSINIDELNNLRPEKIVYITEAYIYEIDYREAVKKGFFRILGGEHKLVVPEKFWKKKGVL